MNIMCPGLRDRRIAAANETVSTRGASSRVYRDSSAASRLGADATPDEHTRYDREPASIRAIVLHQTGGTSFLHGRPARRLASPSDDSRLASSSRLDRIASHFVVLQDGSVFYTHDIQYIVDNAGGRLGIDIEVAGSLPSAAVPDPAQRLSVAAIRGLRALVRALQQQLPAITHIHPHGQIQRAETSGGRSIVCGGPGSDNPCDKLVSCPGPDIWVNAGRWACQTSGDGLGLTCTSTLPPYQNNTIVPAMDNDAYDQGVT